MTANTHAGARRASVLILALWVLFFLAALTVAIASRVASSITVAQKVKTATEARLLAEAGRERVLFEMGSHTGGWDSINVESRKQRR